MGAFPVKSLHSIKAWQGLVCVAILLLLVLALFYDTLTGDYIFIERDLSGFFIPSRFLWVEMAKGGELPLWNPYYYAGHPLMATLQPGVFYPPSIIFLILPFDLAWNYTIILHYFLAGLFTFIFIKWLGRGYLASLAGALTFMLSGYLLSVHNVLNTFLSVTWIPLVTLLYLMAMERQKIRYAILAGIVMAVIFLGGGVEVAYTVLFFIPFFTLAPGYIKEGISPPPLKNRATYLLIFLAVFMTLSSITLIPFLELTSYSIRQGGLIYQGATTWSLGVKDLIQFFIPDLYESYSSEKKYWGHQSFLKSLYIGAIPLTISTFFYLKRTQQALFFLFMILISLTLAFGKNSLIYPFLFQHMPFLNSIRYPVKFLSMGFFLFSVTVGIGMDSLVKGLEDKDKRVRVLILVMLGLAVLSAILLGVMDIFDGQVRDMLKSMGYMPPDYNDPTTNIFNTKRMLVFFILSVLLLYSGLRFKGVRPLVPYGLILLLATDLFFADYRFFNLMRAEEYHSKATSVEFITQETSGGPFRVFVTPKTAKGEVATSRGGLHPVRIEKEKISPGFNIEDHLFQIEGSDVMDILDHNKVLTLISTAPSADATNLLSFLNVRYVLSTPVIESKEFRLKKILLIDSSEDIGKIEKEKTLKIYENLNYLPRAFLVDRYRVLVKEEDYRDIMSNKEWRPGEEVLLYEEPWPSPIPSPLGGEGKGEGGKELGGEGKGEGGKEFGVRTPDKNIRGQGSELKRQEGKVEVIEYKSNRVRLEVVTDNPKILVMSDAYYPGWKVFVDGKEERVLKANYAFRAVPLQAGEHRVEFVYDPWTFKVGFLITSATILSLIGSGVFVFVRKRGLK